MRLPLVFATKGAPRQAQDLLPSDAVLEVAVACEIAAGNVSGGSDGGRVFGPSWVARCVRTAGGIRKRPRAWVVVEGEPRRVR